MPRLDTEREQRLEPTRTAYAIAEINKKGYDITKVSEKEITFSFIGNKVHYFPYSGWHSSKNIVDGRGLKKLLKQI